MSHEEQGDRMSQLIAKCWADESFKQALLADPAAVLKEEGMEAPAGLSIRVLENTDKVFHLVIPAKRDELSDEDLGRVAGGIGSFFDVFTELSKAAPKPKPTPRP